MAITYHAGRRIQGLERVGSTLTDVDSPWTFANAQGSVSSGAVSFDYNQSTTDRGYHDLGANASGIWVFRFRLNITNKGNPSASNYLCKFGLGDNTNAMSTSQGGIFLTLNHGSSYTRFGGFSSYNQTNQGGNWGSNSPSTYDYSTSTNYYVEVARTGTTTATVKVFTNANYTDNLVFTCTLSSVNASLNVRYVKITTDSYGDQGSNRYNGTMDQMKFYDGITSVVATAGDVKPTNIQVGSRFEETDTRKMYYYEPTLSLTELKAYYKLNNVSGNLVNQAASVGSSSSNSVDMVNTNVTLNETGLFGKSYLYSATDTSNDGSASTNWQFTYGSGAAFTVVTWYKQTVAAEIEQCPIFDTSDSGNGLGSLLKVNGSNGNRQVTCKLHNGSVSETISTATGTFPSDTNWHFIALRATLNGSLKVTIDASTTTLTSSNAGADGTAHNRMGIGNIYRSTNIACRGNLDELSFWNRILTDAEITLLYNAGSGKEISTTWSELGT